MEREGRREREREKMSSVRTNWVMTVIGFAVSMLFIVFICTRLICARIQLRASRRNFHRHLASRSNTGSLERGLHGVEPPIVANFPAKKYSDEYFSSAENGQCSICLAEYRKEDVLRILPYCGHYFHINCIDIWLLQHCTCPVCRISLRETYEKKRSMQLLSSSRSNHNSNSPNVVSYHCTYFSSRRSETHRMDPVQEDHLSRHIDIEEAGDDMSSLEDKGVSKDPASKHVESPSFA